VKSVQAEELRDSTVETLSDEEEEEEEETDESEVDDIQNGQKDVSQAEITGWEPTGLELQETNDAQDHPSTGGPSYSLPGPSSDKHNISDPISRSSSRMSQLSRSPPRSRSPSPDTLAKMAASLSLQSAAMRERVASDLSRRSRQQKKYHTKRGAQRAGRPQGSKAKQDTRVKLDKSGIWE
jgi:RIO kinase 2